MVQIIKNLFRARPSGRLPVVPPGERVYAIGDIHGRLDLFTALAAAIERDDKERGTADTTVIFLGDIVDRGPHSSRVIGAARAWSRARKIRFISGNHEEMFLLSFSSSDTLGNFLKYGGRETILSYDISAEDLLGATLEETKALMNAAVPADDRQFLHGFEKMVTIGDYVFVHAGIRPNEPLNKQTGQDCRWIREPFLSYEGSYGKTIVHGHTVTEEVEFRANRIGIDTGAYLTGKLTALCLEGSERWLLQTQVEGGAIGTVARAA